MRYMEDMEHANWCVSIYDVRDNRLIDDYCFKMDKSDKCAYMVRYVCNNFPTYIDDYTYIKIYKVKRGMKVGVC